MDNCEIFLYQIIINPTIFGARKLDLKKNSQFWETKEQYGQDNNLKGAIQTNTE